MLPLLALILAIPPSSSQKISDSDLVAQLNAVYREYLKKPDVARLVALDGEIRILIHEPWKRAEQNFSGALFQPGWDEIGIDVGHYSDALEYSGKLLVEAHRRNPTSEYRKFTLFAAVMGARPAHGLGEMPDVGAALQYLKEFPQGPFAREVDIILGDFYCDLFKVVIGIQGKKDLDYKLDCFRKYVKTTDLDTQAARARRLSISYYAQALATAPAGWKETTDVQHRHSVMEGSNLKLMEELGWSFCAD